VLDAMTDPGVPPTDFERFSEHFPLDGDLTLQLLKGHLLVETALREVFEQQLAHPLALNGERGTQLTCHQVICLTEAITPISNKVPWLWIAIRKLNSIRNDLAHQLSPKDLARKVNDLIKYVRDNSFEVEIITRALEIERSQDLLVTFIAMCTCLSALKTALLDGI
jgi:hypothetical protein